MNIVCPLCRKQHEADDRLGFPVVLCPRMPPGIAVMAPTVDPPERLCSRCGISESGADELEWPGLIDFRVITAWGEEGFADVTQLVCADCFPAVRNGLLFLGFKDHRHGGINYLEDEECPGSGHVIGGVCPCPEEDEDDPYDGSHVLGQQR